MSPTSHITINYHQLNNSLKERTVTAFVISDKSSNKKKLVVVAMPP